MKRWLALAALLSPSLAFAQVIEPKPAFAGPNRGARAEAGFEIPHRDDHRQAHGSVGARVPARRQLLGHRAPRRLRTVSPKGEVSEPIAGVPPVKVVAAQSFHDVVLDPSFAQNRYVVFHLLRAAERRSREGVADRAHLQRGLEQVARRTPRARPRPRDGGPRAPLGGQPPPRELRGADRGPRRAPDRVRARRNDVRDGRRRVPVLRLRPRQHRGPRRSRTTPTCGAISPAACIRINSDGTIPKDNPWLGRATVSRETFAHGLKDPEGAALHPTTGELWLVDHGPQGGDEINIIRAGHDYGWPEVSYGVQYDARQADGRKNVAVGSGKTSRPGVDEPRLLLGAVDRAIGHDVLHRRSVPRVERQSVRRRDGEASGSCGSCSTARTSSPRRACSRSSTRGFAKCGKGPDGALYVFAGDSLVRITPAK